MLHVMDDNAFRKFVEDATEQTMPYTSWDYWNDTLFLNGCTAREVAKLQTVFEYAGIGVIVTPYNASFANDADYAIDFV